jgi:Type IX secretion system protein PorV
MTDNGLRISIARRDLMNRALRVRSAALAAALLILWSAPSSAQLFRSTAKVGTTSAQFLKIGVGARALGMGGTAAGVRGDISSIYWNPASLARLNINSELTFNHAEWLADINYDFVAGILPIGDLGMFGFSVVSLTMPDEPVRSEQFPEGDGRQWDAGALAIGISYSRSLTDRFSIGFTAKYVSENVWSENATGFAIDVGTLYVSEIEGLTLGASISNFGTDMKLDGRDLYFNEDPNGNVGSGPNNIPGQYRAEAYPLPLTFRIGIAWDIGLAEEFRVTPAIDATHPNDNTEYVNAGLEAAWREIVFGRVGYKSLWLRDSEQGLTWGVGIHYGITGVGTIKLDYAFADYGRLENIQYLSLGMSF